MVELRHLRRRAVRATTEAAVVSLLDRLFARLLETSNLEPSPEREALLADREVTREVLLRRWAELMVVDSAVE